MISPELWKRIDRTLRRLWSYNDVCKAFTSESYVPFMRQFTHVNEVYRNQAKGYEAMATSYKRTGKAVHIPNTLQGEPGDGPALRELELLLGLEKKLVRLCDPETLRIPLWDADNLPDMNRNPSLNVVSSDATATPSLDPEGYVPAFTSYFLKGTEKRPVIISLGGGHRSNYSCGDPACRFFNSIGFHAVLLGHRVGLQKLNFCLDLQRMIRHLRLNADELGVEANRIGAIGFSFGGVVIANYIEQLRYADKPSRYDPSYRDDAADALSGKLNAFLGVYTSSDPFLPRSGDLDYAQYPPTFLVFPGADPLIDFQAAYLSDLVSHGVRVEAHLFDGGVHGFGMGDSAINPNGGEGHIPAIALWPELARLWLGRLWKE